MRARTKNEIILIYITTDDKNNNASKQKSKPQPTPMRWVFLFMQQTNALIGKNPVSGKSAQSNRHFFNENPGFGSLVPLLQDNTPSKGL